MKKALAAVILLFCLSYGIAHAGEAAEKAATAAAEVWLAQIDSGNYANSWKDASAYFHDALTEKA
jgi:hypothetical protein